MTWLETAHAWYSFETRSTRRIYVARVIYFFGLLCFVVSFFARATAQRMTTERGETFAVWTDPIDTHLHLALEPVFQILERQAAQSPDSYGDEFGEEQAEFLRRAWHTLPVACGWFAIWASVLWRPWIRVGELHGTRRRYGMLAASGLLLVNVPFLILAFYREGTVYTGYFHLGAGAYLIVAAYLFVGSSLFWQALPWSGAAD